MTDTLSRRDALALAAAVTLSATPAVAMAPAEPSATPDASFMLGKHLRVIKPGQPMTMDYSDSRVNVEVDDTQKILRVFIG